MKAFLHKHAALLLMLLLLIGAIVLGLFLNHYHHSPKHPFENYSTHYTRAVTIDYLAYGKSYKGTLSAEETALLIPYLQDIVVYSRGPEEVYDYNGGHLFVLELEEIDGKTVKIELLDSRKLYINGALYDSDTAPKAALSSYLLSIVQEHIGS